MKKYIIRAIYALILSFFFILLLYNPICLWEHRPVNKHLNVFVWGDLLVPKSIKEFEKETGISVTCHYYSSNEELLVKLKQQKGQGYDIVFPSDYAIKILADEGYLKPLDKKRLDFIKNIDPFLLNQRFDPNNQYSYPYVWETYGIIIDKDQLNHPFEPTWSQLFDANIIDYKIAMTPDPVEAVALAAHFLYGNLRELNTIEIQQVLDLLKKQSSWVESYADYRAKYLISTKNCPVAFLRSSMLPQIAPEQANVEFLYPNGEIFVSFENMAITSTCEKEDLAYQFMNYFFQADIMKDQMEACPLFPSIGSAVYSATNLDNRFIKAYEEAILRKNFMFFYYFIPPDTIRKIWVDTKS